MTLDFSRLRDVVFYEDTIEFTVADTNFAFNGKKVSFDKDTQYAMDMDDGSPLQYIVDPAKLFGRNDWKTYVSPQRGRHQAGEGQRVPYDEGHGPS